MLVNIVSFFKIKFKISSKKDTLVLLEMVNLKIQSVKCAEKIQFVNEYPLLRMLKGLKMHMVYMFTFTNFTFHKLYFIS